MAMEYKAVPLELKADGDEGVVEGHYSIFGNVDDGEDRMHPGSFAKTIQERGKRVKVFFGHAWDKLIAPPPSVLQEDSTGLFAKYNCVLESFWGNEAWVLIKSGAMTEGSFGFEAVKFDYDEKGVRDLREVKLFEISPVPLGMNPLTSIRAIKSGAIPNDQHLDIIAGILEEIQAGRMLVTVKPKELIPVRDTFSALADAINEKLVAAEPVVDHSPLLVARLRMAEHAMHQLAIH